MTGESILPFGKHKGKHLKDVPISWFTWMYDRKQLKGELLKYAIENIGSIRFMEEKKLTK